MGVQNSCVKPTDLFVFVLCVGVFLPVCMSVYPVCFWCLQMPEKGEGVGSPETGMYKPNKHVIIDYMHAHICIHARF